MSRDVSPIPEQLRRLIRRADATAAKADSVIRQAIRDIRGALAVVSMDEPVATSAAARERAFALVRSKAERLRKRLDELSNAALDYAGKMAASRASDATGLQVRYSKRHADAVIALVSPQQGENLAAAFTDRMARRVIDALRNAVVASFREKAVSGGSMKSLAAEIGRKWQRAAKRSETFAFTDAAGRVWDTKTYLTMNVRTNAMRVYNDLLVEDMAAATKSDLVRVSRGGDPNCDGCGAWEGVILSVSGKTEGFPTYDEAKAAGCFHPNCVHTLEPVDETADADEIARQKKHPYDAASAATDPDAAIRRKHEIDEERYRAKGLSKDAAKTAVDRDRLTDAIRNGLVAENAEDIVKGLTDAQVAALCKGGRPPQFAPAKGTKAKPDPERWNRGKRGGVVHAKRDGLNAVRLAEICGL